MASSAPTNDTNDKPSFLKQLQNTKMGKILVFIVLFTFIFKVINYILSFFDIGQELAYTYMIWFMILFFFFVLLPLKRSYIFLTSPSSSTAQNDAVTGAPGGAPGGVPSGGPSGGQSADRFGERFGEPGGASGGGGGGVPLPTTQFSPQTHVVNEYDAETKLLNEKAHKLAEERKTEEANELFKEAMHRVNNRPNVKAS